MSRWLPRALAVLLMLAVGASALREYRAGYCLSEASTLIEAVLFGRLRGAAAERAVQRVGMLLACAQPIMGREPTRLALVQSLSLILAQRADQAESVLRAAIVAGERPELTLNLGRALAAQGDEAGARAAFLRAMWAAPQVADTLPRTMRESLMVELQVLEQALRDRRGEVPPLPP